MRFWRKLKKSVALVTGVQAVLERRLEAERARHDTHVTQLKVEINRLQEAFENEARCARIQSRRALAAEKEGEKSQRRADALYDLLQRRAKERQDLVKALDVAARWEYGSLVEGRPDWSEKWDSTRGLRILMFAPKDFAGSFFKWASAVNDHTEHAARMVVTGPHQYGYELDLLIPNPNLIQSDWSELWRQADVLHLKDEVGFMNGSNFLPTELLTSFVGPKVFTQYGGYARKHRHDPEYQEFVNSFDEVVSTTPDLCFEWLGPHPRFVPLSIDCNMFAFEWADREVIGHSPSNRSRKGTGEFLEAIDDLRQDFAFELDLIEGVPHPEVMERKRKLGIFFDQAGTELENLGIDAVIGWYGNAALEAAVYGVPTIAHLSEDALSGAERAGVADIRDIPIVNTPLGKDGIASTLRALLSSSSDDRLDLAKRTRRFIEDFHSQQAAGAALGALYNDVTG